MTTTLLMLLVLMAVFFAWGFFVARARGRSAFVWGVACGLSFFVGIAVLYSLGDRRPAAQRDRYEATPDRPQPGRPDFAAFESTAVADGSGGEAEDQGEESAADLRWRYLGEYHPEVRKAVVAVAPMGADALAELKEAHLAVNDAALLPAIVQRIGERFGAPTRHFLSPSTNGQAARVGAGMAAAAHDDEEPLMLEAPVAAREMARRSPVTNGTRSMAADSLKQAAKVDVPAAATILTADAMVDRGLAQSPIATQSGDVGRVDAAVTAAVAATPAASTEAAQARQDEDEEFDFDNDADDVPGGETLAEAPAKGAAERKVVTPADLEGARFLETYAGVHLFGLADGRVFVDRHEARPSLELARNLVDQVAARRALG